LLQGSCIVRHAARGLGSELRRLTVLPAELIDSRNSIAHRIDVARLNAARGSNLFADAGHAFHLSDDLTHGRAEFIDESAAGIDARHAL